MRARWFVLCLLGMGTGAVFGKCRAQDAVSTQAPVAKTVPTPLEPISKRLAYEPHPLQKDLSVLDPRYNPLILRQEEDITLEEIFENEVRDERYAPVFEQRIKDSYRRVIDELAISEKVLNVTVQCKTLSCLTYVKVRKSDGIEMYNVIGQFSIGQVYSPGLLADSDPEFANVIAHTTFEPEMRDVVQFNRYVNGLIQTQMEAFRVRQAAASPR